MKIMTAWCLATIAGTISVPAVAQSTATAAPAQASNDGGDGIVVFGRGEAKIGVAHAASEGTVAGADLLVRPLLRVSELLEAVPGMVAAQHSGSGKANQYFLRGFNLDHGSDFTTYIDGVQMNLRTHGHGQGYLDLNGLIPEIVAREDFRKGPYRADGGDFALAGAAYMTTIDQFDRPWLSVEGGSYGYGRIAAGGTIDGVASGKLTLVGQAKVYDGPWQEPEHLRHGSAFAKYVGQAGSGTIRASVNAYHATWRPTEQIPERIIGRADRRADDPLWDLPDRLLLSRSFRPWPHDTADWHCRGRAGRLECKPLWPILRLGDDVQPHVRRSRRHQRPDPPVRPALDRWRARREALDDLASAKPVPWHRRTL